MRKLLITAFILGIGCVSAQAKQYYLAKITGTGVQNDPFRVDVATGYNYSAVIPTRSTGTPVFGWGLLIATTTLPARAGLVSIPPIALDVSTSSLTGPQITAITTELTTLGVPTTDYTNAPTIREFLRNVVKFMDLNCSFDNLDTNP
jgi:hypothetical protein